MTAGSQVLDYTPKHQFAPFRMTPQPDLDRLPPPTQRTKLWEINGAFHCSIIGTLCRHNGKPWTPLRSSGFASFLVALGSTAPAHARVQRVA